VGIDLSNLTFVNKPSEQYLPAVIQDGALDVVLIDGKHTFPWPMIDWHYTVCVVGSETQCGGCR